MAEIFPEHARRLPIGVSHLNSWEESSPARTREEVQTQSAPPKRLSVLKHFLLSSPKATGAVQSTENHPEMPKAKAKSCSVHVLVSRIQGRSSEINLQGTWPAHGMPSSRYRQQWEDLTTEPAPIEKEDQASRPGIQERQMAFMQDGTG